MKVRNEDKMTGGANVAVTGSSALTYCAAGYFYFR